MAFPACRSARNATENRTVEQGVTVEGSAESEMARWLTDVGEWEAEVEEITESIASAEVDTPGIAVTCHKPAAVVRRVRRVVGRATGRKAVVEKAASMECDTVSISSRNVRNVHSERTRSSVFPGRVEWAVFATIALATVLIIRKFRKS